VDDSKYVLAGKGEHTHGTSKEEQKNEVYVVRSLSKLAEINLHV